MRDARDLLRAAARRASAVPLAAVAYGRLIQARRTELLTASGLVDREYYEAQTGERFANDLEAARHFVSVGSLEGFSPTPLFQDAWYARKTGQSPSTRFMSMFFGAEPLAEASPFFDATRFAVEYPNSGATTTRGALEAFLLTATPDTPLPVAAAALGTPTFSEARADALLRAREQRDRRRLSLVPFSADWDDAREQEFRAATAAQLTPSSPLVSIIMPVRNRERLVEAAIESVRRQQYTSWELLVVDDGSSDGTAAVVSRLAAEDARIVLLDHESRGVSAARNRGIAVAQGTYLAFLDSDNQWFDDFLSLSVASLESTRARAVHAGVRFDAEGGSMYLAAEGTAQQLLDDQNFIDLNTFVAERTLVLEAGGFDESLRRWVDHDLFIRTARLASSTLLPFIGVAYAHVEATDRISVSETAGWQHVVRQKYLIDWDDQRSRVLDRAAETVSVLVHAHGDIDATARLLRSLIDSTDLDGLEIVVVENGSEDGVLEALSAMCCAASRVIIVPQMRDTKGALGANLAFAASSGARVVFMDQQAEVSDGWLDPLLAPLEDPDTLGVAPVVRFADRSIRSAGWLVDGDRTTPSRFLAGHPGEDAARAEGAHPAALTAAAMAMRASDFVAVDGFDPRFVDDYADLDLCLRMAERSGGQWSIAPASVVVQHGPGDDATSDTHDTDLRTLRERWLGRFPDASAGAVSAAGFELDGYALGHGFPRAFVRQTVPRFRAAPRQTAADDAPRLRWAIKTSAPVGPLGDLWGDSAFADDLAEALRARGQDVVVDRRERHRNPVEHLEDVVLTIRGLDLVVPNPGAVNILWVISHPERVTDAELRSYDLVYAASEGWAARASIRSGVAVMPLLQATNPRRFPLRRSEDRREGSEPVFVGSTRGVLRPIVADAIAAGHSPRIYGPGWTEFIDSRHIIADRIAVEELGSVYRKAAVVLNDHWEDMRREGFISNRVFDAVASGTRVVSDDVDGLEELFGNAVSVARNAVDVRAVLLPSASVPTDDELRAIGAEVAMVHSFDTRAATLLSAVLGPRTAPERPTIR